jgi:hypothetical protein
MYAVMFCLGKQELGKQNQHYFACTFHKLQVIIF